MVYSNSNSILNRAPSTARATRSSAEPFESIQQMRARLVGKHTLLERVYALRYRVTGPGI